MKMKILILLGIICVSSFSMGTEEPELAFQQFLQDYNKVFTTPEQHIHAFECFKENLKIADKLNNDDPHAEYGITQFSDLCADEFEKMYLSGYNPEYQNVQVGSKPVPEITLESAEKIIASNGTVDWSTTKAVGPVQDQAHCGSCWAFSAVGNMEGQHYLWDPEHKGTFTKLSEQELVSCSTPSHGCGGGFMRWAYLWVANNSMGITSEENYPYSAGNGTTGKCDVSKEKPVSANFVSYQLIQANERIVMASLSKFGPLSIGVAADSHWQQYKSGVLTGGCNGTHKDHGVLLVGYGTDPVAGDYWKIRNSWNSKWGEEGYIRIKRGFEKGVGCDALLTQVTTSLTSANPKGMCLEKCDTDCCFGGCLGKGQKCCDYTGPCDENSICCGDEGGHQCCENADSCCGFQCCDSSMGKCIGQGSMNKQCCPKESVCKSASGMESCCPNGFSCCPSGECAPPGEECCPGTMGQPCNLKEGGTCCGDGSCCKSSEKCEDKKCVCKSPLCGTGTMAQCCLTEPAQEKQVCCAGFSHTPSRCYPNEYECCPNGGACSSRSGQTCCGSRCCNSGQTCTDDNKCVCKKEDICGQGEDAQCCQGGSPYNQKCCTNSDGGNPHCLQEAFECCKNGQGCFTAMGQTCCGVTCCQKGQKCVQDKCVAGDILSNILEDIFMDH